MDMLTSDLPLPNDAPAIRGGVPTLRTLGRAVEISIAQFGSPGLSIWAADAPSAADVLAQTTIPHQQICVTTMGRLRDAGFWITRTLDPPHHTVWLEEVEDFTDQLDRFIAAFDEPVPKDTLRADVTR